MYMNNKKLISVRIRESLLVKIEEIKKSRNKRCWGYVSTADVIEEALVKFFENNKM